MNTCIRLPADFLIILDFRSDLNINELEKLLWMFGHWKGHAHCTIIFVYTVYIAQLHTLLIGIRIHYDSLVISHVTTINCNGQLDNECDQFRNDA